MEMSERAKLAKQLYINAFNTDESFESPFGSDMLYLIGAVLTHGKISLEVDKVKEFISGLEPELQDQLKLFIME
jgi:hypothetical protein